MAGSSRQGGGGMVRAGAWCAGALSLLPLALVLAAAACGVTELWRRGLADSRFRIGGDTLSLAGAVEQFPDAGVALDGLARRFAGRSLLDPRLSGEVREAYESNEWVREVRSVRRRFPNTLSIEFLLRVPIAQVADGGRYWLLDGDGRLLAGDGQERPATGLPMVLAGPGVDLGPRPQAGALWNGPVRDGLGVLYAWWSGLLADQFQATRVTARSTRYTDARGTERTRRARFDLDLRSTRGGEDISVDWGTYNRGDLQGELPSGAKIDAIGHLLDQRPEHSGWGLDVRTGIPGFIRPEARAW